MSEEKLQAQLKALQGTDYTHCILPGATLIMQRSKDTCPVRTGHLRDSHDIREQSNVVNILVQADYAGDVEYGTSRQGAEPYLRPAIDEKGDDACRLIAEEVNKKMAEVV
jgi:hypothetical protein